MIQTYFVFVTVDYTERTNVSLAKFIEICKPRTSNTMQLKLHNARNRPVLNSQLFIIAIEG